MKKGFVILFVLFVLFGFSGCEGKSTELDPNRTTESCSLHGETKVFGTEHQSIYDCIVDGDGYYYPTFGHHHHK